VLKNENSIFNILSPQGFEELSLEMFRFQFQNNAIYRQWVNFMNVEPLAVNSIEKIPFLPIQLFKNHEVISSPKHDGTIVFTSSSTTSQTPSKHYVNNIALYERSFLNGFNLFYGKPQAYCILALLPNYLQRQGSSLVYMCDQLIKKSAHKHSGFFLDNVPELIEIINELKKQKQKTLLIGVSYALMDLSDKGVSLTEDFSVMETGGMKGRRKEMLKPELHQYLKNGFKITTIHSEYGMTELLSQAYSKGNNAFNCPPWMKVLIREVDDPLNIRNDGKTGGINVIDLANKESCAFIATQDLGRLNANGSFEMMGRYDHSDVRGCNLMMGSF
jgi:phenylacetate-coenzyme A ligase PaaK-like adenylate-forming protein